ncbi:MAG: NADH-quinone oxidoreductase subunit A [Actinomycetota bacterium]
MRAYLGPLLLLALLTVAVGGLYALAAALTVSRDPLQAPPFLAGGLPTEHAQSRYHVRWYAVTLVFLAFDMEMIFMYPWAVVVATVGTKAVVEMFLFLAILMVGVTYAWREGALRWA